MLGAALCARGTLAEELLVNGSFEDGMSGWSGGVLDEEAAYLGAGCVRVTDDSDTHNAIATTLDTIPVDNTQRYRLEGFVRGGVDDQKVLAAIQQYGDDGSWIPHHNIDLPIVAGLDWQAFSYDFCGFQSDTAAIRLTLFATMWTAAGELTGEAWFDELSLTPVTVAELPTGQWLTDPTQDPVAAWIAPVEHKVRRNGILPLGTQTAGAIAIEAAAGETEPAQVVLLPARDDTLTAATMSALVGPNATLPAAAVRLHEVAYVEVRETSDHAVCRGVYPDPLPALELPLALAQGMVQPLWLSVRVPAGTPAGDYLGELHLAFGSRADLRLQVRLHVFGFELPQTHHLQTAYGLSLDTIDRYHHLQGDKALRRATFRLYLQDFAAHRISPYDPVGDDVYVLGFPDVNWDPSFLADDPNGAGGDNRVLEVVDVDEERSVSVATLMPIIPDWSQAHRFAWRVRTDGTHPYLVSVVQFDADGAHIPGHNLDFVRQGDGAWQSDEVVLASSSWTLDTRFVRIYLYAVPWSPVGEGTGRTWFDDVFLGVPGGDNLVKDGDFQQADAITPVLDFDRFDDAAGFALDGLGFDSFMVSLPGFAAGSFVQHYLPGPLMGRVWGSPEYDALYGQILTLLGHHLQERGWLDKAYSYWFDEPEPRDYPFVQQGMQVLAEGSPSIRRLLTEQAEPDLFGYVDIWTPLLNEWSQTWAAQRQAAGDEVWWYVCTGPKSPYPNNFIEQSGVGVRIRPWMAWAWNVQGELYWHVNYWTEDQHFVPPDFQDPWQDPMSYSFIVGGDFGNGDGRLLYPPRAHADGVTRVEGPTPSIRWELLREGLEDYEYLWMLKTLTAQLTQRGTNPGLITEALAVLDLPGTLFSSPVEYTQDPGRLAAVRRQVAGMIEQIQAALESEVPDDAPDPEAKVESAEVLELSDDLLAEAPPEVVEIVEPPGLTDVVESVDAQDSAEHEHDDGIPFPDEDTVVDAFAPDVPVDLPSDSVPPRAAGGGGCQTGAGNGASWMLLIAWTLVFLFIRIHPHRNKRH